MVCDTDSLGTTVGAGDASAPPDPTSECPPAGLPGAWRDMDWPTRLRAIEAACPNGWRWPNGWLWRAWREGRATPPSDAIPALLSLAERYLGVSLVIDGLPVPSPAGATLGQRPWAAELMGGDAAAGEALLAAWLAGRTPETLRAYRADVAHYAAWIGAPVPEALAGLVAHGQGAANGLVLRYRGLMLDAGTSPTLVARRLAALGSAIKAARLLGYCAWRLEVPAPKVQPLRDTRGPTPEVIRAILTTSRPARDTALLRLFCDLALRRGEIASLDAEHVLCDQEGTPRALLVKGKGKRERVQITLPDRTGVALAAWLTVRGVQPGPLFCDLKDGRRLSVKTLYRLVVAAGAAAGAKVRPHGLRHAAITRALDETGGDVRAVQRFSRHAKLDTLCVYDDNRRDLAGAVADKVSAW